MDLTNINVAPNGENIILSIKNDGNVPLNIGVCGQLRRRPQHVQVRLLERDRCLISLGRDDAAEPWNSTAQMTTNFSIPTFDTFTVTVIGTS